MDFEDFYKAYSHMNKNNKMIIDMINSDLLIC